jgi:WD40 repeat protein
LCHSGEEKGMVIDNSSSKFSVAVYFENNDLIFGGYIGNIGMIANGVETKKWAKCSKETVYYNTIKRDHFNNLYIAMAPCKIIKVINIQKMAISAHQVVEFNDIPGEKIQDYWSTDGHFIFIVSINGVVSLFDSKGTLIESLDLELDPEEEVKAMTVSPCSEYLAISCWDKKIHTSSICFLRITDTDFLNKYKTPTRLKTNLEVKQPLFKIIEKFNMNDHFPRLKKNVNSFFLSLSLDTVVN